MPISSDPPLFWLRTRTKMKIMDFRSIKNPLMKHKLLTKLLMKRERKLRESKELQLLSAEREVEERV